MQNWKTETEARDQIKTLVAQYYHDFKEKKTEFQPGDRVTYASPRGRGAAIMLLAC